MHSGFESRKMSQEMMNDCHVIKLSMFFSFNIRFSTLSHWLYLPYPRSPQPDSTPLPLISWLDHRRLQASKTSDKHGQPKATPVVCSCYDLFNSKITYQVPGTRYWQSILYATTLILVDLFLKQNLRRIYVTTTFPHHVIRMNILQQPV